MEPTREQRITLDELLNRVLDKGVVINADIVISLAGIPLLGVNLKAALASMETMLEYGMMQSLDAICRGQYREQARIPPIPLAAGEVILLETPGAYFFAEGSYHAWRHGVFYLTNERLFLFHPALGKIFLALPLTTIQGITTGEGEHEELYLRLQAGRIVRLRARECPALARALETKLPELECRLQNEFEIPRLDGLAAWITAAGERVTQHSKMWLSLNGSNSWQAGHLYLTNKRLCWWHTFQQKLALEIPIKKITAVAVETRCRESILDVIHENSCGRAVACFAGKELLDWQQTLKAVLEDSNETGNCLQCGHAEPVAALRQEGCSACGWLSSKLEGVGV